MKSIVLPIIIVISASGCASTYSQFSDKSLAESQFAKLRPLKTADGWTPMIQSYALTGKSVERKNWVQLGSAVSDAPASANMLPGEYLFMFQCRTGGAFAMPMVEVKLEAGKVYSSRCFNAGGDKIGVEVKESDIGSVEN